MLTCREPVVYIDDVMGEYVGHLVEDEDGTAGAAVEREGLEGCPHGEEQLGPVHVRVVLSGLTSEDRRDRVDHH